MLPPGHIAAGFLTAKLVSQVFPELAAAKYSFATAVFAFLPDLDTFYAFYKTRKMVFKQGINHRNFLTHSPLVYLFVFLIWLTFFPATKLFAICFLLGTASHFFLDTVVSEGIAWFYPFSKRLFRLTRSDRIKFIDKPFFEFWRDYIKSYSRLFGFKLEVLIIFFTLIVLIFSK